MTALRLLWRWWTATQPHRCHNGDPLCCDAAKCTPCRVHAFGERRRRLRRWRHNIEHGL